MASGRVAASQLVRAPAARAWGVRPEVGDTKPEIWAILE